MSVCIVNQKDIAEGLRKLPLPEEPLILVHSSLKAFGYVEGGAQAVINALMDICGSKGTLAMPTLSFKSVNEEVPCFDVKETPSDTGHITEVFRKMPGVKRSMHIFSSLAACGYNADYLTDWHNDTPCSPGSPYGKIIELKGVSLFLGAGIASNTLFHCAEEYINLPYMRYKIIKNAKVTDSEGRVRIADFRRYDCWQTGIIRKLDRMEEIFREKNVLYETQIGNSRVILIKAEDNFRISCEILKDNPDYILEKQHKCEK